MSHEVKKGNILTDIDMIWIEIEPLRFWDELKLIKRVCIRTIIYFEKVAVVLFLVFVFSMLLTFFLLSYID